MELNPWKYRGLRRKEKCEGEEVTRQAVITDIGYVLNSIPACYLLFLQYIFVYSVQYAHFLYALKCPTTFVREHCVE